MTKRVAVAVVFFLAVASAALAAPGQFTLTNAQQVCSGSPGFLQPSTRFSWTVSSGATSYRIQRNGVTVVASTTNTSYEDTNVTPEQQYTYVVFASDGTSETQSANSFTITAPHCTPPPPPTLTATSVCASARAAVQLSWNAVPRATTYDVYRNGIKIRSNLSADTTSTIDTSVTAGTTYSYFVRAENLATSLEQDPPTSPSDSQTVTLQVTNVCPPPPAPPTVTTSASCVGTDPTTRFPKVMVTWTASNGATNYYVSRNNEQIAVTTSRMYEDSGSIVAGSTYTYSVLAEGEGGVGTPGTSIITVPQNVCATPPAAPVLQVSNTCLLASNTPGVSLTWNNAAGATSYTVLRNNSVIASGLTSFQYTDMPPLGTNVTYVLRAVNSDGSADSAPVSITPSDVCPRPPGAFTASAAMFCSSTNNKTAVRVTWTTASGATSYGVLRNGILIASGLTGTSYDDTGVTEGFSYTYTVRATNNNGNTDATASPVTIVDTCPHPPGAFGLTGRAFCSANTPAVFLSWGVSADAVSYTVLRNNIVIASGITTLDYEDLTVALGTAYTYVVRALNAHGSMDSNAVQVTATECNPATPRADLAVSNVILSRSSAAAGDSVDVSYTITNNGDAAAGVTQTRVFIGNTLVLGVASPALAAGASRTESQRFTVPASLAPGPYSLTVSVNDDRSIDETSFANNVSSGNAISILGPVCELSCLVSAPIRAVVGKPVTFDLTNTPSCPTSVQWVFGNNTVGTGETALATYNAPGTYSWSVIVSIDGQPSCTNTGTIQVTTEPLPTKRRPVPHR